MICLRTDNHYPAVPFDAFDIFLQRRLIDDHFLLCRGSVDEGQLLSYPANHTDMRYIQAFYRGDKADDIAFFYAGC